jgi:hypothetical protein
VAVTCGHNSVLTKNSDRLLATNCEHNVAVGTTRTCAVQDDVRKWFLETQELLHERPGSMLHRGGESGQRR